MLVFAEIPSEKTAVNLQASGRKWGEVIAQIEKVANIKFAEITGAGDKLLFTGATVNAQKHSLTSLAKLSQKIEILPFVQKTTINESSKTRVDGDTFESEFALEVEIDWDAFGNELASSVQKITITKNDSLPAVAKLQATRSLNEDKSWDIKLQWEPLDAAALYMIFGGTQENDLRLLDTVTENKFVLTAENPRTTYTFQVFPIDSAGKFGVKAATASIVAGDIEAPTTVKNLRVERSLGKNQSAENIAVTALSWDKSPAVDLENYQIFAGHDRDSLRLLDETTQNYFSIQTPLASAPPVWAVIAVDTSGNKSHPTFAVIE